MFINNGSTSATVANNVLFTEATLPATALTQVASLLPVEVPLNFALPAGYKLNVTLGTTIAAGVCVSCPGGDY